jgi:GxxExxY protein
MLYEKLTNDIISAFYKVYNILGYGFLEKVYENALRIELNRIGYQVEQQKNIQVYYESVLIGDYYADLIINNSVIIELKACKTVCPEHEAQLLNYLKATKYELGLLLNFGNKAEFKRKIFTNERKNSTRINTDVRGFTQIKK